MSGDHGEKTERQKISGAGGPEQEKLSTSHVVHRVGAIKREVGGNWREKRISKPENRNSWGLLLRGGVSRAGGTTKQGIC